MCEYRAKGRQRAYGGHVGNLKQDVWKFAKRLPRAAGDIPTLVVRHEEGELTNISWCANRKSYPPSPGSRATTPIAATSRSTPPPSMHCNGGPLRDLSACAERDDASLDEERDARPEQGGASVGGQRYRVFPAINRRERYARGGHQQSTPAKNAGVPERPEWWRYRLHYTDHSRPLAGDGGLPLNEVKTRGLCTLCLSAR